MKKVYTKNGFEYKCEKMNFSGYWHTTWYYKPITEKIFLPFTIQGQEKAFKSDLEKLLQEPEIAIKIYTKQLETATNLDQLKKDLESAEHRWARVTSPDFDSRGNNPNKDTQEWKKAKHHLDCAQNRLSTAYYYIKQLENIEA